MDKYVCDLCGYEYNFEMGDVENGVEPMTPFEELPENWICPWCGAGKDYFLKMKQLLHADLIFILNLLSRRIVASKHSHIRAQHKNMPRYS